MVGEGRQVFGQEAQEEWYRRRAGEGHHDTGPQDQMYQHSTLIGRTASGLLLKEFFGKS